MNDLRGQRGFSLIEVLIAAVIMASALGTIIATIGVLTKSASNSGVGATAALLCQERLDYFQSQRNPYMAAGGTWYAPPTRRAELDMNLVENLHNRFQGNAQLPVLFVREWLYDTTEKKYADNQAAPDQGRRAQGARSSSAALNVIPVTPTNYQPPANPNRFPVAGIIPNMDRDSRTYDNRVAAAVQSQANNWETNTYYFVPAPRANEIDTFTNTRIQNGSSLPPSFKFMREVWVQTNQPELRTPTYGCPDWGTLGPLFPGTTYSSPLYRPNAIPANVLPPWVVAVTVRVFERDPLCRTWNANGPVLDGLGGAVTTYTSTNRNNSIGYDPRRPLSVMTGYIGLRRTW